MDKIEQIKSFFQKYKAGPIGNLIHASVLIPLIKLGDGWHILYEVRSDHVSQPGDTSFPGGRVENDETYEEAAIRETMEELNLEREQVEVFGEMDFIVSEEKLIHSFVGVLKDVEVEDIQPNSEVKSIFTLPVDWLLKNPPRYYKLLLKPDTLGDFPFQKIQNGIDYRFDRQRQKVPFYDLEKHSLWGFTASLTHRFTEIIREESLNFGNRTSE